MVLASLEYLGGAEEHRHMRVVAAGVHLPWVLALVLPLHCFLNRKGKMKKKASDFIKIARWIYQNGVPKRPNTNASADNERFALVLKTARFWALTKHDFSGHLGNESMIPWDFFSLHLWTSEGTCIRKFCFSFFTSVNSDGVMQRSISELWRFRDDSPNSKGVKQIEMAMKCSDPSFCCSWENRFLRSCHNSQVRRTKDEVTQRRVPADQLRPLLFFYLPFRASVELQQYNLAHPNHRDMPNDMLLTHLSHSENRQWQKFQLLILGFCFVAVNLYRKFRKYSFRVKF